MVTMIGGRGVSFERFLMRRLLPLIAVVAAGGCTDKRTPTEGGGPVFTSVSVSLPRFGVRTLNGSGTLQFANPGRYAVLPQFAATTDFATPARTRSSVPDFAYAIGGQSAVNAQVAASTAPSRTVGAVEAFHLRMREREREEAPAAIAFQQRLREAPPVSLRVQGAAPEAREFKVLSTLASSTYTTISARLVHAGARVLVYLDNQTSGTSGLTDADYSALGRQFDVDLFPIDSAVFGRTSDIDGNGRTVVLFTPVVNRLTLTSGVCGSYVAGFFDPADLSGSANGNRAEVLYQSVPGEPAGGASCAPLSAALVRSTAPATFIHELQHLISYTQHVLTRSGSPESVWLNEGLSHIAEELGGKLYEARYPCPNLPPCPAAGRTNPSQIFPDSAQGFIPHNFANAYDFFTSRSDFSLTSPTGYGTLEERGVAWLFLRWLADQKGERILTDLVQTTKTGPANVEAVTTESFTDLYADFLAAVVLDHFPGATTGEIPSRHGFSSRNLRAIYSRLNAVAPAQFPTRYPLDVTDLSATNRITPETPMQTRMMKPGSFDLFLFTSGSPAAGLSFKAPGSGSFRATLNAQVTLIRLPD